MASRMVQRRYRRTIPVRDAINRGYAGRPAPGARMTEALCRQCGCRWHGGDGHDVCRDAMGADADSLEGARCVS